MLTQTLRALERDGLVARSVTLQVPVRVDYELTPLGAGLQVAVSAVKVWAEHHMEEIEAARSAYDAAAAGSSVAGHDGISQLPANLEVRDLAPTAQFLREVLGFVVDTDEPDYRAWSCCTATAWGWPWCARRTRR